MLYCHQLFSILLFIFELPIFVEVILLEFYNLSAEALRDVGDVRSGKCLLLLQQLAALVVDYIALFEDDARLFPFSLRIDSRETLLSSWTTSCGLQMSRHANRLWLGLSIGASNTIDKVFKWRFKATLSLLLRILRLVVPTHPVAALGPQFDWLEDEWT